jgi:hypothetical protein
LSYLWYAGFALFTQWRERAAAGKQTVSGSGGEPTRTLETWGSVTGRRMASLRASPRYPAPYRTVDSGYLAPILNPGIRYRGVKTPCKG